ncbi:hypothetical protein AB0G06_00005 [Nonomuraea dietziae]|uniref:hypothetical protein n=1 Tax=Nonomuraea dietziae TaxID=65515 RepID=UPI0033DCCF15
MTDRLASRMPVVARASRIVMAIQAVVGLLGLLFMLGVPSGLTIVGIVFAVALLLTAVLLFVVVRWRSRRRAVLILAITVEAVALGLQILPPVLLGYFTLGDLLSAHVILPATALALLCAPETRSWFDR